jgi:hypothetical protein
MTAKNKSRMYLGKQHVSKPKVSWEAQELSDINRNWRRPVGTREHARQMSSQRVKSSARTNPRRSAKT